MPDKHFRYSPSATERWTACPGSIDAPPSLSSVYAEEGTAAHGLAYIAVITGEIATEDLELAAAIKVYADFIESLRVMKPSFESIEDTREHVDFEGLGGTADYMAIFTCPSNGNTVMHIVDYKHGVGVPVEAYENKQLLSYAVIFASHYPGLIDEFRLTIIQPRAIAHESVQTWAVTPGRVAEHEQLIRSVATQTHLKSGPHCRWCSLNATCDVLRGDMLSVFQSDLNAADTAKLLFIHDSAEAIKAALERVAELLIEKAKQGHTLPGHKVVASMSHRKWNTDEAKILRRLAKLGIKKKLAMTTPTLKSPAQVEKLPGLDPSAIADLMSQTQLSERVVLESARGVALDLSIDVFPEVKAIECQTSLPLVD